jgi:hypothetical protein
MDSQTIPKPHTIGLFASILLACSCATLPQRPAGIPVSKLPADVAMNEDAGRGGHLFVTLRLESGEELPFMVDTGSPVTILDKSLEPKLGQCLGAHTLWNFGVEYEASEYAAPKLYLGRAPLVTDSNVFTSDYVAKISSGTGRPILGVLGMDCLRHYCIQLDFKAGKMRFLNPDRLRTARLGQAYSLAFSSAGSTCTKWIQPYIYHAGLAGGKDADLLIDTGADSDGNLEPGLFRREVREQRLRAPANTSQAQEPNNIGLPQCVWNGAIYTSLWVGNGANANADGSEESSLGLRFLARHLVTFDFPHRTMYLKRTRSGPLVDDELAAASQAAGDSAFQLAGKLTRNGQLPGWSRKDRGTIQRMGHFRPDPDTVTVHAQKKGDVSTYHYEFTRASQDSPWQLQRAWRTDQADHMVEEYPVP